MEKQQGFSLIEVVLSLVLITTVFCSLAKALWQGQRFVNEAIRQNKQLQITLNEAEQRGFGLSELIISLALSAFIMSFCATQFVQMKASVTASHATLTKLFDVMRIDGQIRESVHQAGFTPCMTIDKLVAWDSLSDTMGIAPITLQTPSHVVIQRLLGPYETFKGLAGDRRLELPKQVVVNMQHPVVIADCRHAEIHTINKVIKKAKTTEVWLTKPLKFTYPDTVYWGRWLQAHYFIKPTPSGLPALYYAEHHAERLTDDIVDFKATLQNIGGRKGVMINFIDTHQQPFWQLKAAMKA